MANNLRQQFIAGFLENGTGNLINKLGKLNHNIHTQFPSDLGDNRWNSADSRYFGFIPKDDVVGTPMIVYWSMENRRLTKAFNPETGMEEIRDEEMSLFQRLLHIRWSRLLSFINK